MSWSMDVIASFVVISGTILAPKLQGAFTKGCAPVINSSSLSKTMTLLPDSCMGYACVYAVAASALILVSIASI